MLKDKQLRRKTIKSIMSNFKIIKVKCKINLFLIKEIMIEKQILLLTNKSNKKIKKGNNNLLMIREENKSNKDNIKKILRSRSKISLIRKYLKKSNFINKQMKIK